MHPLAVMLLAALVTWALVVIIGLFVYRSKPNWFCWFLYWLGLGPNR